MRSFLSVLCGALLSFVLLPMNSAFAKPVKQDSGLIVEDLVVGNGDAAQAGKTISVHYTGWLSNDGQKGKKFDSSHDRGQPLSFPLGTGRVIKGWDEGCAGMKVGGKRVLTIPAQLAYGSRGAGDAVPPNSDLIFEVELLEVH
ncbi:MAG: FKBP-type peptidyl-prolyl cis-trans isomerase [Bdellovibrionales bacterium]|nr:FKBP-type peptidyl-prolyl cis-trans isomerase [Bdellovibrionales bacterium]